MSDLKEFKHGEEGTHSACKEHIEKEGGKARCCYCVPHSPCQLQSRDGCCEKCEQYSTPNNFLHDKMECPCHKPQEKGECDICGKKETGVFVPHSCDVPLPPQEKEIVAICKECKTEFTQFISDATECPECEGEMIFKDTLVVSPESTWEEKFRTKWEGANAGYPYLAITSRAMNDMIKDIHQVSETSRAEGKREAVEIVMQVIAKEPKEFMKGSPAAYRFHAMRDIINALTTSKGKKE